MARAVKRKRRKDAPLFPAKSTWKPGSAHAARMQANLTAARARRRAILDRTAAGLAQTAKIARGAEPCDLPVIVFLTPPAPPPVEVIDDDALMARARGARKKGKASISPARIAKRRAAEAAKATAPKPAPIGRRKQACRACSGTDHNIASCTSPQAVAYRAAVKPKRPGRPAKATVPAGALPAPARPSP